MAAYNEIVQILGVTAAAYPNFRLLPETVRVYTEMLQDIPGDILGIAAKQVIAQSRFFPTVAELRECSHEIMQGASEIPTAFEAWENAMDQVNKCGDYWRYQVRGREPEYIHPLVGRAVDIIGYRNLLESTNIVADRAHFIKTYESLLTRASNEIRLLPEAKEASQKAAGMVSGLAKRLEADNI